MRPPQRNFVVEFKSRSRQTQARKPASIWGDTDLKAVARQVEDQSAHLFAAPADEPTSANVDSSDTKRQVSATLATESSEKMSADLLPAALADSATTPDSPRLPRDIEKPDVLRAERTTAVTKASVGSGPTKQRKALHTRRVPPTGPENAQATTGTSRADLDALVAENARLKHALRQQLAADNKRLQEMLQRFL